jgi:outer membrane protein assembly factor BamB
MSGPVYWNRRGIAPLLYLSIENDCVRRFELRSDGTIDPGKIVRFGDVIYGHPGAMLSLSSNDQDLGVLWMTYALDNNKADMEQGAKRHTMRGRLDAYDATTLQKIWSSDKSVRDNIGNFAKFNPPTVANGKVYVAAFPDFPPDQPTWGSGRLNAYGAPERPQPVATIDVK